MPEKKLYRLKERSHLGGVCIGLAEYFTVDVSLIRLAFVLLTLMNGLGIMAYFVMWLVVPLKGKAYESDNIISDNLKEMGTQMNNTLSSFTKSESSAVLLAIVLIGIGLMFLLNEFLPALSLSVTWPVVAIIAGLYLLLRKR